MRSTPLTMQLIAWLLLSACEEPRFRGAPDAASGPMDAAGMAAPEAGPADGALSRRDAGPLPDRDAPMPTDSGTDATPPNGSGKAEAGVDAGVDAGLDGGADGGVDAGSDAGPDAGPPLPACDAPPSAVVRAGRALAFGDFDDDGATDFVLGDPSDDGARGAICVYSGARWESAGELGPCIRWTQDLDAVSGAAEAGDRCGAALATGDFDGDGVADLAIGCPGEKPEDPSPEAGQLTVVFGKAGAGLDFKRGQRIVQNTFGRDAEAYDHFTAALAAADFNADGISDLAMGAPDEDAVSYTGFDMQDTGVVNFLHGKAGVGLDTAAGYVGIGQETIFRGVAMPGMVAGRDDVYEVGDHFGAALAVAYLNFDGVTRPTLIIGVPGEDGKGVVQLAAGGTSSGLRTPTARAVLSASIVQSTGFGSSVVGMGTNRVLVGAPYSRNSRGSVWSFSLGSDWTLTAFEELRKGESSEDPGKPNDLFGYSLATAGNTLLVGVPGDEEPRTRNCDEGGIERYGAGLVAGQPIKRPGGVGFGVALSTRPLNAKVAIAAARASDAVLDLRADTD